MSRSRVHVQKNSDLTEHAGQLAGGVLNAKFSHVTSILSALTVGKDSVIFTVSGSLVQAEKTTGRFDAHSCHRLSSAFKTLCGPLASKTGSALVVEIDHESRVSLGLDDFPIGSMAVVCLQAPVSLVSPMICAAIFESKQNGLLRPDAIGVLQATALLFGAAPLLEFQPAADALRTKDFYRRFSNAIRQCFWIVDLESSQIITVSENFEDVWGASRDILTRGRAGRKGRLDGFTANVLPEDRDRVLADFHNHLDSDFDLEFRVLDEAGKIRWIWLRMSPFDDETSPPQRLALLIADDVTEKKQIEERERLHEAALVSRARALAVVDLASGVAHEINNPLTIIVGRASELRRRITNGEATTEIQLEAIDKIQVIALRIADIVRSLKSLSRQDRGADFMASDFASIAHDVLDLSNERFRSQGVTLEIESPPTTLMAEMNPTLVSQVILNLINNALDAVGELKDKWVRVDFTEDTDSIFIGVTDSGSGIPIKIRSRIFDPFFTTKDPGKGTGLGLSLSMSIAAHHDGALRLDTLHAHTRFVFQIPKKKTNSKVQSKTSAKAS